MKFIVIYFEGTENNGVWKKLISRYEIKEAIDKSNNLTKHGIPAYIIEHDDFIKNGLPKLSPERWDFKKKEFKHE